MRQWQICTISCGFIANRPKLAIMQVATVVALLMAVPMAFIVVLTQVNGLQDTARGLVPTGLDPVFGTTTFIVLLLVLVMVAFLVISAGMMLGK